MLESELVRRSVALRAGTRRTHRPGCNEPPQPKFTLPLRDIWKFKLRLKLSAGLLSLSSLRRLRDQLESRGVRHTCFCFLASLQNNQVSRPPRFPRGAAQAAVLVYLYAPGDARISFTLASHFSRCGSPVAAGEQHRGVAEHRDGHGSARRERDPAGGRLEKPRGDFQEENAEGCDVRFRLYLPPRLVTRSCTLIL